MRQPSPQNSQITLDCKTLTAITKVANEALLTLLRGEYRKLKME